MDIYAKIKKEYANILDNEFNPMSGTILLCDDGDGIQYIAKWEYEKPIPEGLTLGKSSQE